MITQALIPTINRWNDMQVKGLYIVKNANI